MTAMLVVIYYCCNIRTDEEQNLRISVYIENGKLNGFQRDRHAQCFDGSANLSKILKREMTWDYITRMPGEKPGAMLVIGKMCNTTRLTSY